RCHFRGFWIFPTALHGRPFDLDALATHSGAQSHELVIERQREREQSLVLGVEFLADRNQAALLELFEPHIDTETQTLAAIADFDLIAGLHVRGRYVLLLEAVRCVGCQVAENLRHFASTDLLER